MTTEQLIQQTRESLGMNIPDGDTGSANMVFPEPNLPYGPAYDFGHPCPNCGYCPHCGRGGYRTLPYYPHYPTWPMYPEITWISTGANGVC